MTTDINPNGPLFHYCSMESLYGILDSLTLRLTSVRYMNDSKEISWLYEHAKNVVLQRMRHHSNNDESKLSKVLLEHCDYLYLDDSYFPNYFCACFSRKGDSLSQWKAYADDGRGVAIGFNRDYLTRFTNQRLTRLQRVDYDIESEVLSLEREMKEAYSRMENSSKTLMEHQIETIARETCNQWDERAPFCKNPGFEEENEFRLVHLRLMLRQAIHESEFEPLKFCHRDGVIVPFLELPLDPDASPISRIVLGPRNRAEHNRSAIMDLAQSKGLELTMDQFAISSTSYGEVRRPKKFDGSSW